MEGKFIKKEEESAAGRILKGQWEGREECAAGRKVGKCSRKDERKVQQERREESAAGRLGGTQH
jgi:hypothetical protein